MPKQLYFFHPVLDACFAGGLSLVALAFFLIFDGPGLEKWSLQTSLFLLWFINWPHFSATLQRLYHSRDNMAAYPLTAWLSPLVFIGLGSLVLLSPYASVPVHLYALWAPFHFSSQALGIAFIYARRAGIQFSSMERRAFVWFCHSSWIALIVRVESMTTVQRFGVVSYPSLGLPMGWVVPAYLFFGFCSLFWLGTVFYARKTRGRFLPAIVLLPVVGQVLWFSVGPFSPSFNLLVPMFHSLQYLPLVWWMQMKTQGYSRQHSFQWLRTNFLGGALLFWGAPAALSVAGFSLELARVAVFTAVNLHHFYIDGIIWKLRNARVSAPLIGKLVTSAQPA